MRSARIRTSWKNKRRNISAEEHATAVAAAAWRIALTAAKNLHAQRFVYANDAQRLGVIGEYLYLFIHITDRHAQAQLTHPQRANLITLLSTECRRHHRENWQAVVASSAGEMSTTDQFIHRLNQRMTSYANTRFIDQQPGYDTYRTLSRYIQDGMKTNQTNKWVQDQVLEIDGPEAVKVFSKALVALNQSALK